MAGGHSGVPGAVAARRVAVDHKHACALAPVLHQAMVALTVQGLDRSLRNATLLHVLQVTDIASGWHPCLSNSLFL